MPTIQADTQQLVALLRQHLLTDAAVKAIVGGRVYGAHVREPDLQTMVYPLVIVELEGGSSGVSSTFQAQSFYLYAYDRSSASEAARLYGACYEALQHQLLRRDDVPVAGYAMETQRPEQGHNAKANAYWMEGLWILRAGQRST